MNPTHRTAVATFALLGVTAFQQACAQASPSPEQINQIIMSQCPKMVSQLAGRPELAPVMAARPIQVASVCACTGVGFSKDTKLQDQFRREPSELAARMQSDKFKSYMFARLLTSVLSCLTPEFDASLDAAQPD